VKYSHFLQEGSRYKDKKGNRKLSKDAHLDVVDAQVRQQVLQ